MTRLRRLAVCALLPLPLVSGARAGTVVRLDPERSRVSFTLGATLHTVEGTLAPPSGSAWYDPSSGRAGGSLVVAAASAVTGSTARDRKMHAKVLQSGRYPQIVLTLAHVEGTLPEDGEGDLTLHGAIEIHGGSHTVEIPVHVRVVGRDISGTARFPVPYVDWGMQDPSVFVLRVEKRVDVTVTFTGTIETGAPAGARDEGRIRIVMPPG